MVFALCGRSRHGTPRVTSVPPSSELTITVDEIAIRRYCSPAPPAARHCPAVRAAVSTQPVTGYVVGVREATHWGWWGPLIDQDVVEGLRRLTQRGGSALRGTPQQCAATLRCAGRHAHTGIYSVGIGAFELACWDLVGQRNGVPVWQLFTQRPARARVASYATCFGLSLDQPGAADIVAAVGDIWTVQKWRPVTDLRCDGSPAVRAALGAGPAGLALDFGDQWSAAAALRFAAAVPLPLAFLEEPAAPDALADLAGLARPAPVAAGEHCYNPGEATLLAAADIDIWQPDAVFCGGFGALQTIAERAAAAGRLLYPHGGGLIPALHAAIAGWPIDCLEFHLLLEPRRQAHLRRPVLADDHGEFGVPDRPGWAGTLRDDLGEP